VTWENIINAKRNFDNFTSTIYQDMRQSSWLIGYCIYCIPRIIGVASRGITFPPHSINSCLLDINKLISELSPVHRKDPAVQHALEVRSALSQNNYFRFFRLYSNAPNMGGYLMDKFLDRERVQAMLIMCKA
jgi:hypothetical protein